MSYGAMLPRGVRIAGFDGDAVRETADDPGALGPALVLALSSGLASGLGNILLLNMATSLSQNLAPEVAPMYRDMAAQGPVRTILAALLGALVGLALVPALLWGLGKLFGGEGGYLELVKSYGHVAGLLGLLGVIPCLGGFIAVIWTIATVPVQLTSIHRISIGKAIGVTAITYGLLLITFCGFALMNAAAQMAAGTLPS